MGSTLLFLRTTIWPVSLQIPEPLFPEARGGPFFVTEEGMLFRCSKERPLYKWAMITLCAEQRIRIR